MAVVERTIIAGGGGDYTTIGSWESATNLGGGSDIWKGVISDNSAYDEAVEISDGGFSTDSHIWLDVAPANRHAGIWDTGKARLEYSGGDSSAITIRSDYARVSNLQIYRPSTGTIGNSDEGIRVTGTAPDGCLIERCIIWTDSSEIGTDGIYTGNWAINSLFIDHCVVYGWERAAINFQQFGSTVRDQTVYVDHCSLSGGGLVTGQATLMLDQRSGGTSTMTIHNTWMAGALVSGLTLYCNASFGGSDTIVNGGNVAYVAPANLDGNGTNTFNWTDVVDAVDGLTTSPPTTSGVYIVDDTLATFDMTPVADANSALVGLGTNRQGSEPDPRQDFSTDIAGNPRSTTVVDIGAFQISTDGAGPHVPEGGAVLGGSAAVAVARSHVAAGGVLAGGSAVPAVSRSHVAAGGALVGGAALASIGAAHVPAGGLLAGGSAAVSARSVHIPGGGLLAGGSAAVSASWAHVPAGGLLAGGSAAPSGGSTHVPAGGLLAGGSAAVSSSRSVVAAGGAQLGGSAPAAASFVHLPAGGVELGGSATPTTAGQTIHVPAGGIQAGGSAVVVGQVVVVPAGGLAAGGGSVASVARVFASAGGLVAGGSAFPAARFVVVPSGGAIVGGTATIGASDSVVVVPSGGLLLAGAATPVARLFRASSGGAELGGSAVVEIGPAGTGVAAYGFRPVGLERRWGALRVQRRWGSVATRRTPR